VLNFMEYKTVTVKTQRIEDLESTKKAFKLNNHTVVLVKWCTYSKRTILLLMKQITRNFQ